MWWNRHFASIVFHPKTYSPSLIKKKTPEKYQLRDFLQNTTPVFKTVKVIINKESQGNCRSLEEPKETWLLNAMYNSGWDPGMEKGQ